jgi:hypothetical protein
MMSLGPTSVQYVFLDIVRFTQNRSVEAQADIVHSLNDIVKKSLEQNEVNLSDCILLPTGDGIAIAILQAESFDLALKIAQHIIVSLHVHNADTQDQKRKFEIRVGVNQNIDNIIVDINGSRNVAGRGINMAQRVMSLADGGQIIVGQPVFEILREREAYEGLFRELQGKDKHGNKIPSYQFIRSDIEGLNTEIPTQLRTTPSAKPQMDDYAAHFIAHASRHREFFLTLKSEPYFTYAATILLHFLSRDSIKNIDLSSSLQDPILTVELSDDGSPAQAYKDIAESDFSTIAELAQYIGKDLSPMGRFFEYGHYETLWPFPTEKGKEMAREKFPKIWAFVQGQLLDLT